MTDDPYDLAALPARAAAHADAFDVLRWQLQLDDALDDEAVDALVDAVAAPIVAAIDCTQCGNCCRSLDVYLVPDDAVRLAAGVGVPLSEIETRSIDRARAAAEGEWGVFAARPCAFLHGTLCSVYPHRPDACRRYPQFTPDFRWVLDDLIAGAALCPIIFAVLLAMTSAADALQTPG